MDEIKRLERRTVQYWFEDGIWEMGFGAISLVSGICLLGISLIPTKSLWRVLSLPVVFAVLYIGVRLVNRAVRSSKEKWTYPRTGFVSYRRQNDSKLFRRFSWRGGFFGFAFALVYGFLRELAGFSWVLVFSGLVLGFAIFYNALRTSLIRFYILSAIIVVAGAALAGAGLSSLAGLGLIFAVQGVGLIATGRITFVRFIRDIPISAGNEV